MKKINFKILVIVSILCYGFVTVPWGFYGHRKINRMATFTLPTEMFGFYKKNIEYITEHAVDPDKRRYATKLEAIRHYIDIDHWGKAPFDNVPQELSDAIVSRLKLHKLSSEGDTTLLIDIQDHQIDSVIQNAACALDINHLTSWVQEILRVGQLVETTMTLSSKDLQWLDLKSNSKKDVQIVFEDCFSSYGIAPYFVRHMMSQLSNAFRNQDGKRILRLSAEIGHYIGDIHVPLHTTENYNGELTDQIGIHAFWETRLPELFADDNYDFMVGRAEYISDEKQFFWDIVYQSHALLEDVLMIEKNLSHQYPSDQQYCYEERNNRTIRTECEEYAKAYHEAMNGMVERRMQDAILALGSAWYTCWINAGQPDLTNLTENISWNEDEEKEKMRLEDLYNSGNVKGRAHGK